MQVYKGAKQLKMSNKELIKLINQPEVDHHMDKIPDEMLEELGLVEKKINTSKPEPTKTVDSAKTVIVGEPNEAKITAVASEVTETISNSVGEQCPYTNKEIGLGIRCLGGNAPQYKWRHLIV